jgi:DNA-binding transcriptional ArsR family regulator
VSAAAATAAVRVPSPRRPGPPVEGAAAVRPQPQELFVPKDWQGLSESASRLAGDSYSWMQAVHWVKGSGRYNPRRHQSSGPRKFNVTTVRVAQVMAEFVQCRPGTALVMARTGLSRRSVNYHLRMLRETGLLGRIAIGTREAGGKRLASEYVLMVPPEFDTALGIRTVQRYEAAPDYTRAAAGISETGRALIATLGKKAVRKVRKPRPKKKAPLRRSAKASPPAPAQGAPEVGNSGQEPVSGPDSGQGRCTPMQGGSSPVFTDGRTPLPSESERTSGQHKSFYPKKAKRGPRKLNKIGQRFALATELMRRVPWLAGASKDRVAWVVREVSDAGWTADEVLAALDLREEPRGGVRRPSGYLSARLRGMATLPALSTKQQRSNLVDWRNAAVEAARKDRIEQLHNQQGHSEYLWDAPRSIAVRREVDQLLRQTLAPESPTRSEAEELPELSGPQDLSATELAQMRRAAAAELVSGKTSLISTTVDFLGQAAAEHIYGVGLVHRAQQLKDVTPHTRLGIDRWRR